MLGSQGAPPVGFLFKFGFINRDISSVTSPKWAGGINLDIFKLVNKPFHTLIITVLMVLSHSQINCKRSFRANLNREFSFSHKFGNYHNYV